MSIRVPVNLDQNLQLIYVTFIPPYTAHLESVALKQAREANMDLNKDDCGSDYFAFGENSPKPDNQDTVDCATHSRDVDDWLLSDKWGKSSYPSVPDSEAATAIESILNE